MAPGLIGFPRTVNEKAVRAGIVPEQICAECGDLWGRRSAQARL